MQQKLTVLGTYLVVGLIAGLAGGAISRLLPGAKVIRAERIELIDKSGNPGAVFEFTYGPNAPEGVAVLNMKAEYAESPNLPMRSAETTSIQAGSLWITKGKELLVLGPGSLATKNGDNNTTLHGSDLLIRSSEGNTSMDGSRIAVLGKSGAAVIPAGR